MSKKTTQRDKVIEYIRNFGSITSWQAYADLGITQLGARIFELEDEGYVFRKETVESKNRYGEKVQFKKYLLYEDDLEKNKEHIPIV